MSESDEEYDSGNAKHIKKRKQEEKNAQGLREDDLKFLMSQPQFRRFMWHLFTFTNIYSVAPRDAGEREVGFLDGGKNVGLKYLADIQDTCPERYSEMVEQMQKKGHKYDD